MFFFFAPFIYFSCYRDPGRRAPFLLWLMREVSNEMQFIRGRIFIFSFSFFFKRWERKFYFFKLFFFWFIVGDKIRIFIQFFYFMVVFHSPSKQWWILSGKKGKFFVYIEMNSRERDYNVLKNCFAWKILIEFFFFKIFTKNIFLIMRRNLFCCNQMPLNPQTYLYFFVYIRIIDACVCETRISLYNFLQ